MKVSFTTLIFLLCSFNLVLGQEIEADSSKYVSSEYHTNSITTMLIKYNKYDREWKFDQAFANINRSPKYYVNDIGSELVTIDDQHRPTGNIKEEIAKYTEKKGQSFKETVNSTIITSFVGRKGLLQPLDSTGLALAKVLENQNYDARIMKSWATRDNEGNFPVLNERSSLNLSANDIRDNADGNKLDVFKPLLERNYIMVFDIGPIVEADDYYREYGYDNQRSNNNENAYVSEVNTYIYKLEMDDTSFDRYKRCMSNAERGSSSASDYNSKLSQECRKLDLKFNYVGRYLTVIREPLSQENQVKDQYSDNTYNKLAQSAYDEIVELAEMRIEDFKVRTVVTEGFPYKIKAEVGRKENLRIDQRYFAYEYIQNPISGKSEAKLRGVIRTSAKIADNIESREKEDGTFKQTVFNQIWGAPIKKGMFLVQENDFGIAVGAGFLYRTGVNFNFRGEYNVSQWAGKTIKNYPLTGTKFFLELFDFGVKTGQDETDSQLGIGFGLSTTFYLNKWLRPEPFLGYYAISNYDVAFFNVGARLAYPISYNLFVVPELALTLGGGESSNPFMLGVTMRYEL